VRFRTACRAAVACCLSPTLGYAQPSAAPDTNEAAQATATVPTPMAPAAAKPAPYSLPWQLRPVSAGTALRWDTTYAHYNVNGGGSTIASMLLFSYKIADGLAPLARIGVVENSPPNTAAGLSSATGLLNPVVGLTYAPRIPQPWRLGLFLAVAAPVGAGGGNSPSTDTRAALSAGIPARSAMDNAMFAVNYLTVFPGVGFAYVDHGLTMQAEVTLLRLMRARGDQVDRDAARTNFTAGLHVGYYVIPELSLGAELRHQRWLSTPTFVQQNAAARDTSTVAVGARLHVKFTDALSFHPGVAVALPLDDPMKRADYRIVQLDLPLAF